MGACFGKKEEDPPQESEGVFFQVNDRVPVQVSDRVPVQVPNKTKFSLDGPARGPKKLSPPKKNKLSLKGLGDMASDAAPKFKIFVVLDWLGPAGEEMEIQVTALDEILLACNREVNEKCISTCHYGGVEVSRAATFADLKIEQGAKLILTTEEHAVMVQRSLFEEYVTSSADSPMLSHIAEEDAILKQDLADLLATSTLLSGKRWQQSEVIAKVEGVFSQTFDNMMLQLPPTDPVRLAVAVNYAIFTFECQGDTDKACDIATVAFESAIPELDTLSEETLKQSTLLLQVIRDCCNLWEQGPSSPRIGDKFGPCKGPGSGRMVMFE